MDPSEIDLPGDLRYARDHEWLSTATPARLGISDYAQSSLGDLTYVELPEVGRVFRQGDELATLESAKSASPVYAPVDGTVRAVNEALMDDPGAVNRSPYGDGWLVEIDPTDPAQADALFDAGAYRAFLESLG